MLVDVWATMPHYLAHLEPIYQALPEAIRGEIYVGYTGRQTENRIGRAVLVGAYRDLRSCHGYGKRILVEHGAGQTYQSAHPAYSGGVRDQPCDLYLVPGYDTQVWDLANEIVPIGCPKLDPWILGQRQRANAIPTVAFSWHWDCGVAIESGTTFWQYRQAVQAYARYNGSKRVIVHGHPRIQDEVQPWAAFHGLIFEPDFDQVLAEADLYVCDNSSTIYEFAALGRPVVLLNGTEWRRTINHGGRFWDWADVGLQVDYPELMAATIDRAWEDPAEVAMRRIDRVNSIYGRLDGYSATRAALAVVRTVGSVVG